MARLMDVFKLIFKQPELEKERERNLITVIKTDWTRAISENNFFHVILSRGLCLKQLKDIKLESHNIFHEIDP